MAEKSDNKKLTLSEKQKHVIRMIVEGKNVIFTGPAGTGKSLIIRSIYKLSKFRGKLSNKCIKITAMTGKAAEHLPPNATTLHRLLQCQIFSKSAEYYIDYIKKNRWIYPEWKRWDMIIIDEISMLNANLLTKIDKIFKGVLENNLPFGGKQIVASGDFFQLPPVKYEANGGFCFESPIFNDLFPEECRIKLNQNFRQLDPNFANALRELRVGIKSPDTIKLIKSRVGKKWQDCYEIEPPYLMPTKKMVNIYNKSKMDEIDEELRCFKHQWKCPKYWSEKKSHLFRNQKLETTPCMDILELKKGAIVMHTINNYNICKKNGSTGKIIDFDNTGNPIVRFNDGSTHTITKHKWFTDNGDCYIDQYPLIVAWAISIHKSQGSEFDCVQIHIGDKTFEAGQIYVAISRCRYIDGIFIDEFAPNKIYAHPKVLKYEKINIDDYINTEEEKLEEHIDQNLLND